MENGDREAGAPLSPIRDVGIDMSLANMKPGSAGVSISDFPISIFQFPFSNFYFSVSFP
jgi:hypothetical protein